MFVLEEIFKSKKCENTDQFNLRIHRGLSWFKRAVQLDDDLDMKFICLWISFNAIYAQELVVTQDKPTFRTFLEAIFQADAEHRIDYLLWEKMSLPIRVLLNHPYAFQEFWDYQNNKISQFSWKKEFEQEKQKVYQALQKKDSVDILCMLFSRLYTLKQQILSGGVTYKSSVNRQQLQDSCNILSAFIPIFIRLLLENAQTLDLEKPFYPVVQMS
ncbi:HEPN domain-containing protein [Acinetobacter sp. ANC 4648]|uniref:HEPN domain-containing protein n=1 Tax=Acinetobacter sp. ANC 4648 TaxID=1977875 RepID=UPI000A332687|nr:HEPN domain-containing protein [Acinetobacter sp. ANC 4648]OTG83980.1 hypothetical protein B9T27_05635 [Acinetobacter sp. ANC 4648]